MFLRTIYNHLINSDLDTQEEALRTHFYDLILKLNQNFCFPPWSENYRVARDEVTTPGTTQHSTGHLPQEMQRVDNRPSASPGKTNCLMY